MFDLPKWSSITAGVALLSVATVAPATAASMYSVTELPFLPSDINDIGQIVGQRYFWDNGNLTDLKTLPGAGTNAFIIATAINNKGTIVGYTGDYPAGEQVFTSDGITVKQLNPPPSNICGPGSCTNFVATDINDSGQIALIGLRPPDGIRYGADGLLRDTDGTSTVLLSGRYVQNVAINNSGQAIGNAGGAGQCSSYFFNNGTKTQLFSPNSNLDFFCNFLTAFDINDRNQVVGGGTVQFEYQYPYRRTHHALLWNDPQNNPNGAIDLGTLGGGSEAKSINNAGQIVGYYTISPNIYDSTRRAFFWENSTMLDLNNLIPANLGWELSQALKINDKGQIVGYGYLNGQQRGFLLTPVSTSVPEPVSILSLLGFGVFGILRYKRKQQLKK